MMRKVASAPSKRPTGPRTAAGKAASSTNATKHGVYAKPTDEELAAARRLFDDFIDDDARAAMATRTFVIFERARREKLRLLLSLASCDDPTLVDGLIRAIKRIDEYERKARSRLAKDLTRQEAAPPQLLFRRG